MKTNRTKKAYENIKDYAFEIKLDLEESFRNSDLNLILETFEVIPQNELHYMIKYHYKIVLVSLYFNKKSFLIEYYFWLYRVYYFKNIDLDFFVLLNELFKKICKKYVFKDSYIVVEQMFDEVEKKHEEFKKNAKYKRTILEDENSVTLAQKLLKADTNYVEDILNSKALGMEEFLKFYNEDIVQAMKYIGYKWEAGEISIAKEHIATSTLEDVILKFINNLAQSKTKNRHIFLTAAPTEYHGLAMKVAAAVYRKLGYKVTSLGINASYQEIRKALIEFMPDYIIIAATLRTSLVDVALVVEEIKNDQNSLLKKIKVVVAGSAFDEIIDVSKKIKADFYLKKLEDIEK